MLQENEIYTIQPIHLEVGNVVFHQDEKIQVIGFDGLTVNLKRLETGEIVSVSKYAIEFGVF